jgi:glyoxylase I family protein
MHDNCRLKGCQKKEIQMLIKSIHHVALICSDYQRSKYFYVEVLKLHVIHEAFRQDRSSFKLDLALPDGSQIELFSFLNPPPRLSRPEAQGLRHLAFAVTDIVASVNYLERHQIATEPIRVDEYTNKKFTFFTDPDGLPLELYES